MRKAISTHFHRHAYRSPILASLASHHLILFHFQKQVAIRGAEVFFRHLTIAIKEFLLSFLNPPPPFVLRRSPFTLNHVSRLHPRLADLVAFHRSIAQSSSLPPSFPSRFTPLHFSVLLCFLTRFLHHTPTLRQFINIFLTHA